MLITNPSNRRYITGFTGSAGYALITQNKAIFITDFRYIQQAKTQAPSFEIVQHSGSIVDAVKEQLINFEVHNLGFEKDDVTYSLFKKFEESFSGVKLVPLSQVIESLRIVKDEEEIKLIKKATEIADQAFSHILNVIKPGIKEVDVSLELEFKMRELGAQGASFEIIVASGFRSALPHGIASEKVIETGDFVTIDFGAIYNGYVSDITRTVVVGKASEKQKEIYNIVLEAQLNGVNKIRAGMTGKEADALTRDIIARYGYAEYFGHGTGHGIGLDVHEAPTVSHKGETVLKPGMLVTVEPGIYIPEFGGVRIEDDLLITETGNEILTKSTKDLIIID
ncbi:Xaa-Pro dipeptidase [Vulcanibacillus modesticaldus]|uniref:Xaa-Pro dipeptidase n=2 Tax=Vulcanibacillus modesticaldus TaxID=337097 RepID=A0A1D2YS03_9BACI|nr:Xaa-Pro dipeptidase [Vulcanibacillus modesticaldus]